MTPWMAALFFIWIIINYKSWIWSSLQALHLEVYQWVQKSHNRQFSGCCLVANFFRPSLKMYWLTFPKTRSSQLQPSSFCSKTMIFFFPTFWICYLSWKMFSCKFNWYSQTNIIEVLHTGPKKRKRRTKRHDFPRRCSCVIIRTSLFYRRIFTWPSTSLSFLCKRRRRYTSETFFWWSITFFCRNWRRNRNWNLVDMKVHYKCCLWKSINELKYHTVTNFQLVVDGKVFPACTEHVWINIIVAS